ncbi:hypothetical protein P8452_25370 [Trifolium repens]|nr:hypothetical protein P8452_25370 [Trifolium repens]
MKGTFEIYSPLIHTSQLSSVIGPCEWQLKAIYNFKPTPVVPKSYSPQDLASFLLVSYLEYTCHCCFTALHMDTKDKPVGRSSTINPKVKDGKVSLETDTLQDTLLFTLSSTLRLLSLMWTDHMTQLRTSPKKGKPEDHVELFFWDIKGDTIQATLMQ